MTRLFLVRHGQTDWNSGRRFQGQAGPGLNEAGRRQVQALAARLAQEPYAAIYSSDLERARQTAEILNAGRFCPVYLDPALRELAFGTWEGLTYLEIQQRDPHALSAWEADWEKSGPPGGESLADLERRVKVFLEKISKEKEGQTFILAAHGGPLQVLICLALGLPAASHWRFALSTASLSVVQLSANGGVLQLLNDTCHLDRGEE
jgi:alpha-ribazole phosphatase